MNLAVGPSSIAGIITAVGTVIIAMGSFVAALGVAVPLLRRTKHTQDVLLAHGSQLRVIKTLVDGTLSAAKQAELASTRRELHLMQEIMEIKGPSTETLATIGAITRRISELEAEIKDRSEQLRSANIQIATEAERVRIHGDGDAPSSAQRQD